MIPVWTGFVSRGRVNIDHASGYEDYLQTLEGRAVEVIVRPPKEIRSSPSNRYYFGIVIAIMADAKGWTKDAMHESMAWRFLRNEDPDNLLQSRRSTSDLSPKEFAEYVEQVKQFAAEELDLYIPDPDSVEF